MDRALLRQNVLREDRLEADDVMLLIEIWRLEDLAPVNRVEVLLNRHLNKKNILNLRAIEPPTVNSRS